MWSCWFRKRRWLRRCTCPSARPGHGGRPRGRLEASAAWASRRGGRGGGRRGLGSVWVRPCAPISSGDPVSFPGQVSAPPALPAGHSSAGAGGCPWGGHPGPVLRCRVAGHCPRQQPIHERQRPVQIHCCGAPTGPRARPHCGSQSTAGGWGLRARGGPCQCAWGLPLVQGPTQLCGDSACVRACACHTPPTPPTPLPPTPVAP